MGKLEWMPRNSSKIDDWCIDKGGTTKQKRDQATVFTLVMWEIRKHRSAIIFEGASPSKNYVILRICQEGRAWKQAGLIKGDTEGFFQEVEMWSSMSS